MKRRLVPAVDDAITTTETLFDKSLVCLNFALDQLNRSMTRLATNKADKSKFDVDSRIAFLAGKIGGIMEVVRKMEMQRKKRFDELTPAFVLSWLRALPAGERRAFLAEAEILDQKRSGLS